MSCDTCGKIKCCCVKTISKQGVRGKVGPPGPTGPVGPANAYLTQSVTPLSYTDARMQIFAVNFTCTAPGKYAIWHEATYYPPVNSNDTIVIEVTKNGVLIPLAGDEVKFLTTSPNITYKNAINTGVTLALGDLVNVYVTASKGFVIGHRSLMLIPVNNLTTF